MRARTTFTRPAALLTLGCVTLLSLVLEGAAHAAPATPPSMEQAEGHMRASEWKAAAQVFSELVVVDPKNEVAWVRYGRALLEAGEYDKCIEIETKAATMPSVKTRALYNLACAHAAKGDKTNALRFIQSAFDAGFTSEQLLTSDPRFKSLQDDPEFKAMIKKFRADSDLPVFHAFDFWAGDWDVYDNQANVAGTNKVESLESGCLITETRVGSAGGSGRLMHYYNPGTQRWHQIWVDNTGNVLNMEGRLINGAMWFEGDSQTRRGIKAQHRTIFTPLPGSRVRQTIHIRNDASQPWVLGFDCVYVPKGTRFTAEQFPKEPAPGANDAAAAEAK